MTEEAIPDATLAKDYFELKALEKNRYKKCDLNSPTPCFSLKSGHNVPIGQLTSLYQEERNVLATRDEESKPREFYKNRTC